MSLKVSFNEQSFIFTDFLTTVLPILTNYCYLGLLMFPNQLDISLNYYYKDKLKYRSIVFFLLHPCMKHSSPIQQCYIKILVILNDTYFNHFKLLY